MHHTLESLLRMEVTDRAKVKAKDIASIFYVEVSVSEETLARIVMMLLQKVMRYQRLRPDEQQGDDRGQELHRRRVRLSRRVAVSHTVLSKIVMISRPSKSGSLRGPTSQAQCGVGC